MNYLFRYTCISKTSVAKKIPVKKNIDSADDTSETTTFSIEGSDQKVSEALRRSYSCACQERVTASWSIEITKGIHYDKSENKSETEVDA